MRSVRVDQEVNLYNGIFADVYHLYWKEYIEIISPQIVEILESVNLSGKKILDLCCGTGRMSRALLESGFEIYGLDLSEDMIRVARRNNKQFVDQDLATFVVDDARSFSVSEDFACVISTFDSLNHLESMDDLSRTFSRVFSVLSAGGMFLFDLNTKKGLRHWEFVDVEDNEDTVFIMHGGYNAKQKRAYTRVYGFHRVEDELWKKFDELFTNQAFVLEDVQKLLQEIGFSEIKFLKHDDLHSELEEPEDEERIIVKAIKPSQS